MYFEHISSTSQLLPTLIPSASCSLCLKRKTQRQKTVKTKQIYGVYFILSNYSLSWTLPGVWLTFLVTLLQKRLISPSQQLSIAKAFLVSRGIGFSLPFSMLGFCLVRTCACPVCVFTVDVSSYMYQSCCVWMTLFLWSHPSPLVLTKLLLPFPYISIRLEGRSLIRTSHGGWSAPKSQTLHTDCLCVSMLIITLQDKVFLTRIGNALIHVQAQQYVTRSNFIAMFL